MWNRLLACLALTASCDASPPDNAPSCGEPHQNAQSWTGGRQVHLVGAAAWTTATALVGTAFVDVAQLDLELLVATDACTHRLTFNVRRPEVGVVPFGLISVGGEAAFSGGYAGDLPSQVFTQSSTLTLTELTDTRVSGRFAVDGDQGLSFTAGTFTGVPISGERLD